MSLQRYDDKGAPNAWLVWAALWVVYIVWGSTYLAIRVVVETMPPLVAGGARFLIAGLIVVAVLALRGGWQRIRITRREAAASAAVGTALLLGGNGLVSIAERDVPSGLAALIIAAVPLWVIVLRRIFDGTVPRGTLVGVAAGFAGVAILMLPGERPDGASIAGMLMLVAAAAAWATGSFFSKRLPLPTDPFVSTGLQMVFGGVIMVAAGGLTGEFPDVALGEFSRGSWIALAYLVGAGSLLAFTAYTWLLQNAPISKVATYAYVNPVIAVFLGWAFVSEEITPSVLIAAPVIVASVAGIVRRESRPAAEPESVQLSPLPAGAEVLEARAN